MEYTYAPAEETRAFVNDASPVSDKVWGNLKRFDATVPGRIELDIALAAQYQEVVLLVCGVCMYQGRRSARSLTDGL